jgi:hypothetical protein
MNIKKVKKYVSIGLKLSAFPVVFMVAEAIQIVVMVALIGLAVPLPSGTIGTGLAAYGGLVMIRYLFKVILANLRAEPEGAMQLHKHAAAGRAAQSMPASPVFGGEAGPRRPDPASTAALRAVVASLQRQRMQAAAKASAGDAEDEGKSEDDGHFGQYL